MAGSRSKAEASKQKRNFHFPIDGPSIFFLPLVRVQVAASFKMIYYGKAHSLSCLPNYAVLYN